MSEELILRDYQLQAIEDVREEIRKGNKRIIISAPTGSGKTVIAAQLIKLAVKKGSRVEFVADRRTLVDQTSKRFNDLGIKHGVLMGASSHDLDLPVRISSAQTIARRGVRTEFNPETQRAEPLVIDLSIDDECHEIHTKAIDALQKTSKHFIGLTATPLPKELAKYYDCMINVETTERLIAQRHLVSFKVQAPLKVIDIEGLKAQGAGGEFKRSDVGERILRVVGDIIGQYKSALRQYFDGQPQPTIVFCASIKDTEAVCKVFTDAGYDFDYISSKRPEETNSKIIALYNAGSLDGIVNCNILTRGFDAPRTRILMDLYPLRKSLLTLIQRYGRVMRTWRGKEFGVLIDMAENYLAFHDDVLKFYKYGPPPLGSPGAEMTKRKKVDRTQSVCKHCFTVFEPGAEVCSSCGRPRPRRIPTLYEEYNAIFTEAGEINGDIAITQTSKYILWREICTAQKEAVGGDQERANKRSLAVYKNLTGAWPASGFNPYDKPSDPRVKAIIQRSLKAWKTKQYYRKKKQDSLANN